MVARNACATSLTSGFSELSRGFPQWAASEHQSRMADGTGNISHGTRLGCGSEIWQKEFTNYLANTILAILITAGTPPRAMGDTVSQILRGSDCADGAASCARNSLTNSTPAQN